MEYLWPIVTGRTFLDAWFLPHLGFWLFVGSGLWALKLNKWLALGICLGVALLWEVFELFAFKAWPSLWQDPESWVNSWLSDPFTCVVGVLSMYFLLDHRRRATQ